MKSFNVSFKKSAFKELQSLPKAIQQKLLDAVQILAINPKTQLLQIKKLKGVDSLYRFRMQDYRVIYTLDERILSIVLIKIGHRN